MYFKSNFKALLKSINSAKISIKYFMKDSRLRPIKKYLIIHDSMTVVLK